MFTILPGLSVRTSPFTGPGCTHHITQRGNNRQNVFFVDDDRRLYLRLLIEESRNHGLEILAYCLMSNQPASPRLCRPGLGRQRAAEMKTQLWEYLLGKSLTGFAVGAGVTRQGRQVVGRPMGLDAGQGAIAGLVGVKDLADECPERYQRGEAVFVNPLSVRIFPLCQCHSLLTPFSLCVAIFGCQSLASSVLNDRQNYRTCSS